MNTQDIIQRVQAEAPMNAIISDLIEGHALKHNHMRKLYREYKGDVFIKHREYEYNEGEKIDRKLANDFRGYIVDTLVGYTFGNPVRYSVDKDMYNDSNYDQVSNLLKMFGRKNSIADLDAEVAKKASICGYGARLAYVDGNGDIRLMNIDPWECVFIKDASLDEPQYAMRYYEIEETVGDTTFKKIRVEWYDDTFYQEFESDYDGIFKALDTPKYHMFDGVPLIEFPNDEERIGDFEKVRELIDAYDTNLSDVQSELEEQRLAYMVFRGSGVDAETLSQAKKTGAFNLPDPNDSVNYLIKTLNDAVIENQKATLRENIHKFSKTVDMSDEKFSGASQSGESRKWKMLAMENLAVTKVRKFSKSLRIQFRLIEKAWIALREPIVDDSIYWQFKRNIPVEITQESQILAGLNGHVSHSTRLGLASFIEDPEEEIKKMQEDQEQYAPSLADDDE